MATAIKKPGGKRANSKSAKIREYFGSHPDAGPAAVVAGLRAKGVKVSAAHVSNVKAKMQQGAPKAGGPAATNGAVRRKPGRPKRQAAASDLVSASQLIDARKFAAHVGGVDNAVSLLQTLAKLQ
jgi:hypothetical protein